MKKGIILIAGLLMQGLFCNEIKAQIGLSTISSSPPQYFHLKTYYKSPKSFDIKNSALLNTNKTIPLKPKALPMAFSVECLPFFCKIEYKMGIHQKLPIKFRLGDVQYVDELEGK
jgi:hypothetical protein